MASEINFKGFEISKITQEDLFFLFPEFNPLLVSVPINYDDEKMRVLEILTYSIEYGISKLTKIITDYYKNIYPDIF